MILGLDVSTSCTGICVLDYNNNIVQTTAVETPTKKYDNIYVKADILSDTLLKVCEEYEIKHIYVEEALMNFQYGRTSANTLSLLHKFNGIISYMTYKMFNIKPIHLNATSARSMCGIKVKRGQDAKAVVMERLTQVERVLTVELTRQGNVKSYFYDIADAIIIAKAGLADVKHKQTKYS